MTFLRVGSGQLYYEQTGVGDPPLVFVHGLGCAHEDWQAQKVHFGQRNRVVSLDLRGHGRSRAFESGFDMHTLGADVVALLSAMQLAPAILVGHSMGCRIVLEASRVAPEAVAGLVLVDGSRLAAKSAGAAVDATRSAIEAVGYESFWNAIFEGMFIESSNADLRLNIVKRAMSLSENIGAELFVQMCAWDAEVADTALRNAAVPLLVLQSTYLNEDRERVPLQAGMTTPWLELIKTLVPDANIEIVEGAGHFTMIEAPETVNARIGNLVEIVSGRRK